MRCPYCAEEVKDDAIVCKHCQRELFVVKPLLNKINDLTAQLAAETQTAEHAEAEVEGLRHARRTSRHESFGLTSLEAVALTYITLVALHFVVVVHFNLRLIFLQVGSIAFPFIFGFCRRIPEKRVMSSALLWSFVAVVVAISTMLAIVAEVDKIQFLPRDAKEWFDFARYSASVAFGFLTGVIARLMLLAIFYPNSKPNKTIDWVARFIVEQFGDGRPKFTLKSIRSMVSSILGFVSAVISILTGLWEYLLKN